MKSFIYFNLIAIFITSCNSVPLTGRRQLSLISDAEVLSLSNQSFSDYMKTAKISSNQQQYLQITRVGTNIVTAVDTYLRSN